MNTEIYKEKFADEMHEQIWRKCMNLEYDKTKIPSVQKLQADKFKELDEMKAELAGIDPKDTTKVTRTKRKELEGKIAKAEEFIVSCDETISLINESIKKDKEKIKNLKERVEFANNFVYDESNYADDNKIRDLKRADYNPRIMPDTEMAALKTSIKTFGFVEPIVVNKNTERYGVLVGGHQRLSALEAILASGTVPAGITESDEKGVYLVPASFVDLSMEDEKLLNLALNKIKGKWDEEKLADIIIALKEDPHIPASGFRDDEISRILDQTLEDEESEEEAIDDTKEPRSKIGEIYELGPHRLICGDSTDPEVYRALLGKEKADMVFTDPPYNVNYHSRGEKLKGEELEKIKNDNMTPEEFKAFIDGAFYAMFMHAQEGASFYICSGWSSYPQFLQSMLSNGFRHSGVIIWVKNVPSMGWNDYRYKHEWIAKAKKPDPKTAESIIYGWKTGTHTFFGDNEYDVWEMPRKATARYLHPTEKPDWLAMRALRNSTKRNDIVLDPFGGSGSTMMAAEKTGRRAYMIELDPKFCDVIRDRWERASQAK